MIWDIEWNKEAPVFGFDFAEILHEGIEVGMEELEYLVTEGTYCDYCSEYRVCYTTKVDEVGGEPDEILHMEYQLCMECRAQLRRSHPELI